MNRKSKVVAGLIGTLIVVAAGFYLFRMSTVDNSALGLISHQHSWGRVTRVSVDSNRDGRIDGEYIYSWQNPYSGTHGNDAMRYREDRNHDGLWDTWRELSESVLRIDTDGDEVADMELDVTQSEAAYAKAKEIRGY